MTTHPGEEDGRQLLRLTAISQSYGSHRVLHDVSLTVPRGWEVLRLAMPSQPPQPGPDDLLALADAVREAAARPASQAPAQRPAHSALEAPAAAEGTRRGHLRILREPS